jgi:hypothetical protein
MLENARSSYAEALAVESEIEQLRFSASAPGELEAVVRELFDKAVALRLFAQQCAKGAAPYVHPRLSPVDPKLCNEAAIPLAERLKEYDREYE